MLTRRNTKEEMLTLIDQQERIIERYKNRLNKKKVKQEIKQLAKTDKAIEQLQKSKETYKQAYQYQRRITKKKDEHIQLLLTENLVHMKGKMQLQDDLFQRDLIIHSLMNS